MRLLLALLCCAASQAQAATVFKCVDAAGKVTFTQQQCPEQSALHDVVRANNPTPSGSGQPTEMAPRPGSQREALRREFDQLVDDMRAPARQSAQGVNVVGGDKPCSTGMSERDERTAVVRKQAVQGMTRQQIESMYGKPDNTTTANGEVNYRYWNDQARTYTSVRFDQNGCSDWVYQSRDK